MGIDWTTVGTQLEQAVAGVLGAAWKNANTSAGVAQLMVIGQQIENDKDTMQQVEYDSLKIMEQRALAGVLQTELAISVDVAQQAVAAGWGVLAMALKAAYPVLGFIP
jgi:hypothetical protein